MKNHKKFLNACNQLTKTLTDMFNLKMNATMGYVIRATRYRHPVIKHHYDALVMFVELRNVLVHETYDQVLAEPTDDVVEHLEHIVSRIVSAKTLKDMFLFEVTSFYDTDPIDTLFRTIQHTKYSHFPIFSDQQFLGVLTENGITHLVASKIDEDIISLKSLTIRDVLNADEHHMNYKILKLETPLYEAVEVFDSKQHPIQLVLLSDKQVITSPKDIRGMMLPKDVAYIVDDML